MTNSADDYPEFAEANIDTTPWDRMRPDDKITPFHWQPEAIRFLHKRKGALLADEQGVGKTVEVLFASRELNGPIMIICRPLAKPYWRSMIKKIDPEAEICTAGVGGVFKEEKVRRWFGQIDGAHVGPRKRGYFLIHHEALTTPKDRHTGKTKRDLTSKLRLFGVWEAIIADEAHRFKNRKTQMTQSLWTLVCKRRWALTGTPMEKSPGDFWPLLHWFDNNEFPHYWPFVSYFTVTEYDIFSGHKSIAPKNLEVLAERVGPYYLRRVKEDIPGFPRKMPPMVVPVKLTVGQELLYKRLQKETLLSITQDPDNDEETFIANAMKRMHLMKKCALDPSLLGSEVEGVKVKWLLDWMEDYPDKPFVVFTGVRDFANGLPLLVPGGETISGSFKQEERDATLEKFQAGKLRYIVGTIDTMSESINLQRAGIAIFTDIHRSSIAMQQAEERIHRADSPGPTQVIYLLAQKTVDEQFFQAYTKKMSDSELVAQFLSSASSKR
jgi:SNF2 family DNA or RNA helicase